ncbi:chromosome partitioning protein ParA [Natronococcus pandeyae]|uniref:Chromosome partitioning protein ParA n=1 Tax=Natronococcus pandeyae TaxID=2055836 RepID=A0A8J8Q538_9EURY|nr:P-loop NTPase [Natronococcus pandeyae]TYL38748.1 chromosome partitioning protein ParA [Natronococcus pandeyae]
MDTTRHLQDRLRQVEDPELGTDIVSLGLMTDVRVDDGVATVSLAFNAPLSPAEWTMCDEIRALCQGIGLEPRVYADTSTGGVFPDVKNTIAIGTAEPDAETSLLTANLAAALASIGARVGVFDVGLDADRKTWLERVARPDLSVDPIEPPAVEGISVVRLEPAVPTGDALLKGAVVLELVLPAVVESLEWGSLDYLLVRLPRGTGRSTAAVAEQIPIDGAIAVSPVATDSSLPRTAVQELNALGAAVIGAVETVDTGESDGDEPARRPAALDCPHLGTVPLDRSTLPTASDERADEPFVRETEGASVLERSPFRELAVSVIDRIGAVNRRSVADRQFA